MKQRILAIAQNEITSLTREGTIVLMLSVFLLMALASAYIGWSAQETVKQVYKASVEKLQSEGKSIPADPFANAMPLAIHKNMMIYVVMIGALLSVTTGYSSGMRDRKAAVTKLVLSRPIRRSDYLLGKMTGVICVLFLAMLFAYALGLIASAMLAGNSLTSADFYLFTVFYGLSLLYMAGFAFMGLFFALILKNEETSLLIPVVIWLTIAIVLPQLTSALLPTNALNPVTDQTKSPHSDLLSSISGAVKPFSLSEQYKEIAGSLLETGGKREGISNNVNAYSFNIFSIILFALVWFASCFAAIKRFNAVDGDIYA